MDRKLAEHVARVAFRSEAELNNLVPLLKRHCDDAEYNEYLKAIAGASASINAELLNRIFSRFPDLKNELETSVRKYGTYI